MKARNQIQNMYKWKTSDIYTNEDDLQKDMDFINSKIDVIKSYKGKLNNKKDILALFNLEEEIDLVGEKLGAYLFLKHSENLEVQKYVQLQNKLSTISTNLSVASSFIDSELLDNGLEFLEKLANDKDMANYKLDLLDLIRFQPHILSETENKVVAQVGNFAGGYSDVFDNIDALDVKFKDFVVDGKKYEVNNSIIKRFFMSSAPVRQSS